MTRKEIDEALSKHFDTGSCGSEDENLYLIPYCSNRTQEYSHIQVDDGGVSIGLFRGDVRLTYDEISDIDIFLDEIQPAERMPRGIRYQEGNVTFATAAGGEITVWVERHEVYDRFWSMTKEERGF